jgi:monooxygenase
LEYHLAASPEHFDVVIVGAGLSGIDAAYHLQKFCPKKSYVILEQRERIGGTWDLFRYPGIRSDSDMLTMGYSFRPWTHPKAISPGEDIREYITATARDEGIDRNIRFRHQIKHASWSSEVAQWTIETTKSSSDSKSSEVKEESVTLNCNFLFCCAGYYRYSAGYLPEFPNSSRFKGRMFHPQAWPEDLDYVGKRVVIIGSGATAVTLVPAMAKTAAHVTMLQRSPTYVISAPEKDRIANFLRHIMPAMWAYRLSRWKNVGFMTYVYQLSQRFRLWDWESPGALPYGP